MAGLDPAIHVFATAKKKDVDARDVCASPRKTRFALLRGHDEWLVRTLPGKQLQLGPIPGLDHILRLSLAERGLVVDDLSDRGKRRARDLGVRRP